MAPAAQLLPPTDKPLRVALVIAGAVSLGSYEAGALTALLQLIRLAKGDIVVDTIVGASAGSITGLLLAHTLLTGAGLDDEQALWVTQTDLERLLKGKGQQGRPRGPLSTSLLENWAADRLKAGGEGIQTEPICLVLTMANLQGLSYRMVMRNRDEPVRADTYRDAAAFAVDAKTTDWSKPMLAAIASSAHAFAFSAVWVDRVQDDYPREIVWIEETKGFWYTDGGTVYNEPLGFALDAVYSPKSFFAAESAPSRLIERVDRYAENDRLFLLVHPHPDDPLSPWPKDGGEPVFGESSLRAFNMQRSQSLYQDLQTLERYNSRLHWRAELEKVLATADTPSRDALADLGQQAEQERRDRRSSTKNLEDHSPLAEGDEAIKVLLDAATGTSGKHPAWVEVVSPQIQPDVDDGTTKVGDLLAGEGMGHFLGFADVRARRSDFRLGYENCTEWWQGNETPFRALVEMDQLSIPSRDWDADGWKQEGQFSLRDVPFGRRLRWALSLLIRYYKELRALRKRAK